jgi:hypothetical protein
MYFYVKICKNLQISNKAKTLENTEFISIFKGFHYGGEKGIRTLSKPIYIKGNAVFMHLDGKL